MLVIPENRKATMMMVMVRKNEICDKSTSGDVKVKGKMAATCSRHNRPSLRPEIKPILPYPMPSSPVWSNIPRL
jgi:hypothetical protein